MVPIDPGGEDPAASRDPAPPLRNEPRISDESLRTDASLRTIVPLQAMAYGGTILRPGAVAWGGTRSSAGAGVEGGYPPGGRYPSCEAIERALAAAAAHHAMFPDLLTELAATRLWIPLPSRQRPFTDGSAVLLPLVSHQGTEFVPCFTSVQRLTAWAADGEPAEHRAGDPRPPIADVVPHVVVAAAGLADRLPAGTGMALNPGSAPGLPLYPECVPYLGSLASPATGPLAAEHFFPDTGLRFLIGHPPAEPTTLLAVARTALRSLPSVARASRAWLTVPGAGSGMVFAIGLDDPASAHDRAAAAEAIERAAMTVPLRVPFPLDVSFPGEAAGGEPHHEAIDDWIADNTRPFYLR